MSDIVDKIAQSLVKDPNSLSIPVVVETALDLITAAWNSERDLSRFDSVSPDTWSYFRGNDAEKIVAAVAEIKRTEHENDHRRIESAAATPDGGIRVYWSLDRKYVESPIAARVVERLVRATRGKLGRAADLVRDAHTIGSGDSSGTTQEQAATFGAVAAVAAIWGELLELKEVGPILSIVSDAEAEYLPSFPPMSPITDSHFIAWSLFDASHGASSETAGSIVLRLGVELGMDQETMGLIRMLCQSRTSLYIHEGNHGKRALLRELRTNILHSATCPAGYSGQTGELWYARVLPPQASGRDSMVLTTPYIILAPGPEEWLKYLDRTLPKQSSFDGNRLFEAHMKFGTRRDYWLSYIFDAYANYEPSAVFLTGLPDRPLSLPHSEANWRLQSP